MRKHWGFVSRYESDALIEEPIVYVSFSSVKLRTECQELVRADYKDNFVSSCYYGQKDSRFITPHFDTIDDFILYMKERVKEDEVYLKMREWSYVEGCVHNLGSMLITIERRGMPQDMKHHASELLKAFRGELEKAKKEAKE